MQPSQKHETTRVLFPLGIKRKLNQISKIMLFVETQWVIICFAMAYFPAEQGEILVATFSCCNLLITILYMLRFR